MQISRILALLAVVSTGFALSIKRDTATVESDLNEITGRTKVLDDKIVKYDGTLGPALEIHSDSINLIQKIDSSTTDVKSTGPFSETDGHTVLGQVQGLEPIIHKTLMDLIAKKESFEKLPIGGVPELICQDLQKLQSSTNEFSAVTYPKFPADQKSAAMTVQNKISEDFKPAIADYC